MKRIIVTLISAFGLCAMASAQDATVSDVWLEHNVYKSTGYYNQTVKGLEVHFTLEVEDLRQQKVGVAAFFAYHDGDEYVPLRTRYNTQYRSSQDNSVCTWTEVYPKYDSTYWEDFVLFIPYSEISRALPESASMACCVNVFYDGIPMAISDMVEFEFNKN